MCVYVYVCIYAEVYQSRPPQQCEKTSELQTAIASAHDRDLMPLNIPRSQRY